MAKAEHEKSLLNLVRKADMIKAKLLDQQGYLISATKADQLPLEVIAGALLVAVQADDSFREMLHAIGDDFFNIT